MPIAISDDHRALADTVTDFLARHQALAVALSETVGGGLTAAGLFSPLGPAMIIGVMSVATQKVHLQNGLWITNRGYEYNLALAAAALLLAWEGPGALSLDAILRKQRSGPLAGIAALALGVGAGQLAMELSQRLAPAGSGEGSGEGRGGDEAAASD